MGRQIAGSSSAPAGEPVVFHGDLAELKPRLEEVKGHLSFTHHLALPAGRSHPLSEVKFFSGRPAAGAGGQHLLLAAQRAAGRLAQFLGLQQSLPVHKLSRRLLTQLRKTQSANGPGLGTIVRGAEGPPALHFRVD